MSNRSFRSGNRSSGGTESEDNESAGNRGVDQSEAVSEYTVGESSITRDNRRTLLQDVAFSPE